MTEVDRIGKYSGLLSVAESGLGSVLHAYHIPMAGHLLSLNQGFLLSRYVEQSENSSAWAPYKVSLMAAAVKSLSPMGKRLTPMLGISIQGLLFSTGIFLFGTNVLGAMVGAFFLSIWAFIQPALILFIIFGKDLIGIGQFYYQEAQHLFNFDILYLGYIFLGLIFIKILAAQILVILAFSKSKFKIEQRLNKLSQFELKVLNKSDAPADTIWQRLRFVASDLLQPWFLLSLLLSFLFFYLTNPQGVKIVWYMLRPVAMAAILFYIKRFYAIKSTSTQAS